MKKSLLITTIIVAFGVFAYATKYVYDRAVQSVAEEKIREAGLNPDDYDLSGIAPWNIREFVTSKEIEKAGLDPNDYNIKGQLTADEVRLEVIRQEIAKQLAEYDLSIDDIDLSGIDLIKLSTKEIEELVYQKVREKINR